jgi:hypothetical protein
VGHAVDFPPVADTVVIVVPFWSVIVQVHGDPLVQDELETVSVVPV